MSSIYVIDKDKKLIELSRSTYDSEDLFQKLLADHPAMLSHAAGSGGKLLLIRREQPVPDANNGMDRWSLDHLFLDRQGVPVLVEVKQASDTRTRREVVAQMLDYAANGVAYWPIDRIIESFRHTVANAGIEPDTHLAEFLEQGDPETFWKAVEANLRSGRIRMLFVADRIPKELARIVEFLNEQMRPAEVLALEVEQYKGESGLLTLVPKLVGQTQRAQITKSVATTQGYISEGDWLDKLQSGHNLGVRNGAERAIQWLRSKGIEVNVTASQDSMAEKVIRADGRQCFPFFIRYSSSRFDISLQNISYTQYYRDDILRRELLERLHNIHSKTFKATKLLTGWPSISLEELLSDPVWNALTPILTEIITNIEAPAPNNS